MSAWLDQHQMGLLILAVVILAVVLQWTGTLPPISVDYVREYR